MQTPEEKKRSGGGSSSFAPTSADITTDPIGQGVSIATHLQTPSEKDRSSALDLPPNIPTQEGSSQNAIPSSAVISRELYEQILRGEVPGSESMRASIEAGNVTILENNALSKIAKFFDLDTLTLNEYLAAGLMGNMNVIGMTTTTLAGLTNLIGSSSTVYRIGRITLTETGRQVSTKTVRITVSSLAKVFSKKAMVFYGAWAGAVALGKWGQAESIEAFTFPSDKFYTPEAMRTGDWSLVDASDKAAREMADLSTWQKVGLWSPLSPFIGIPKKITSVAGAQVIREKFHDDQKEKQAKGTSEADFWKNKAIEEAAQDKAAVDYFNNERKKMLAFEIEAKRAAAEAADRAYKEGRKEQRAAEVKARNDDAAYWAEQRAKQRELEAEDRKAIADFWIAYRKLAQKISDNNRPSNLKFGLL